MLLRARPCEHWRMQMKRHLWRWWPNKKNERPDAAEGMRQKPGSDERRKLLKALSAVAGGTVLFSNARRSDAKDSSDLPPPRRALTGRDGFGKSVFKSFDVTPKVVEI